MRIIDRYPGVRRVPEQTPPRPDPVRRRLYDREEALLKRLQDGEDTPELRAELEAVREAIRRSLRHENGLDGESGD